MKSFVTSGTGNQQTLEEIESDKIPIYDSVADVTADLANLEEGQLVATKDTGTELSQPVDVVQSGNLHAVTSNAVATALSGIIENESINVGVTFGTNKNVDLSAYQDGVWLFSAFDNWGAGYQASQYLVIMKNGSIVNSFYLIAEQSVVQYSRTDKVISIIYTGATGDTTVCVTKIA